MTSPSTLLEAVNNAIIARLNGNAVQSYSTSTGVNIQYMSLGELRAFRSQLIEEESASNSIASRTYADFQEPG